MWRGLLLLGIHLGKRWPGPKKCSAEISIDVFPMKDDVKNWTIALIIIMMMIISRLPAQLSTMFSLPSRCLSRDATLQWLHITAFIVSRARGKFNKGKIYITLEFKLSCDRKSATLWFNEKKRSKTSFFIHVGQQPSHVVDEVISQRISWQDNDRKSRRRQSCLPLRPEIKARFDLAPASPDTVTWERDGFPFKRKAHCITYCEYWIPLIRTR